MHCFRIVSPLSPFITTIYPTIPQPHLVEDSLFFPSVNRSMRYRAFVHHRWMRNLLYQYHETPGKHDCLYWGREATTCVWIPRHHAEPERVAWEELMKVEG